MVIGMSDGLTVPFALAAGLSGAIAQSSIVITAGLAEIAAGAIAMGLGGYLAARSDAEHYASELTSRVSRSGGGAGQGGAGGGRRLLGLRRHARRERAVIASFRKRPDDWVRFMMRFELGLEEPHPQRALRSAATIAASYRRRRR